MYLKIQCAVSEAGCQTAVREVNVRDTEILDLYWNRDERAISESNKSFGGYCHSIAFNILHDREDSDECVNDTWLRAWNVMPPKRPDRLAIFLGTITRNLSIDRWKMKKAAKRGNGEMEVALDELAECIPAMHGTEEAVEAHELEHMINEFMHRLSERDCNVFLRRYYFLEEYSAISERYGLNINTVKTSLHRTRDKLREYLEKEGVVL
jgi:RNA polymerase sigma-70 factor (ECF subfamily)